VCLHQRLGYEAAAEAAKVGVVGAPAGKRRLVLHAAAYTRAHAHVHTRAHAQQEQRRRRRSDCGGCHRDSGLKELRACARAAGASDAS
jgi:hypothetical protein